MTFIVAVPACTRTLNGHGFHIAGDKYVRAVAEGAGAIPLIVPALPGAIDLDRLLDRVDGVLLTGSPSNVAPERYGGPPSAPGTPHDPDRDAVTLSLIRKVLERDLPLLAICRGHQELNVALGGTLHQRLHEVPGLMDHRAPPDDPVDVRYAPRHLVALTPGGFLQDLVGGVSEITVNSLHWQGIDRLAEGLAVEATAPDGVIEAIRVPGHRFALGVQWHPEWCFSESPASTALLRAFGAAMG